MRTPDEIKRIVCNIVRFKRERQPWDAETMLVCIKLVEGYKARANGIIESLRKHRENIPTEIVGGLEMRVITESVATEGRRIRDEMERLIEDFLEKECEGS